MIYSSYFYEEKYLNTKYHNAINNPIQMFVMGYTLTKLQINRLLTNFVTNDINVLSMAGLIRLCT